MERIVRCSGPCKVFAEYTPSSRVPRAIAILSFCLFGWTRVAAQTSVYQPPGTLAKPPEHLKHRLTDAYDEARLRLGPLRLQPWASVSDLGYTNDISGAVGDGERRPDGHVTFGLGAKLFMRAGKKSYMSAYLLPQYHWWAKTRSLRNLAGRYGAGLFGFYNRLTLTATLTRRTVEGIRTPEILRPALYRMDQGRFSADLRITDPFLLVLDFSGMSVRDDEGSAASSLRQLDRDETTFAAGFRYEVTGHLSLAAMAVRSRSRFSKGSCSCDNSGTFPRIEAVYASGPFRIQVEASLRDLRPDLDSLLPVYRHPTWLFAGYLDRGTRMSYSLYTKRDLLYAAGGEPAFLEHDLVGGAVRLRLGHRAHARIYLEGGADHYLGGVSRKGGISRKDQSVAFGLDASLTLRRSTALVARLGTIRYRSNLRGFDRNVSVVSLGVSFGGGAATPW